MKYQLENFNGNYDFRCRYHDGWVVENHLHEYSEFLFCKEGCAKLLINDECISLTKNQLVWLPPNYIHQYLPTDAELICAVFSNDYIPLFFEITKGMRIVPQAIDFSDMRNIISEMPTYSVKNILHLNGILNLICARVVEKSNFKKASALDDILYQKIVSYISSHFNENLSLKLIANKFGYNEKYLSHSLHELTGLHFSKLISLYRIQFAKKNLIEKKQSTISSIAYESGFSSINTFNRVFKEFTGVSPKQYRNSFSKHFKNN